MNNNVKQLMVLSIAALVVLAAGCGETSLSSDKLLEQYCRDTNRVVKNGECVCEDENKVWKNNECIFPEDPETCSNGKQKCDNNRVMICTDGEWKVDKSCAETETCNDQTFACDPNASKDCEKVGSHKCDNNRVMICTDNEWTVEATCEDNETCNEETFACDPNEPEICDEEGAHKCDNNRVMICTDNEWTVEATCEDNETCNEETFACEPNVSQGCGEDWKKRCSEDALQIETCTEGFWVGVNCNEGQKCVTTGDGPLCAECENDDTRCVVEDGVSLLSKCVNYSWSEREACLETDAEKLVCDANPGKSCINVMELLQCPEEGNVACQDVYGQEYAVICEDGVVTEASGACEDGTVCYVPEGGCTMLDECGNEKVGAGEDCEEGMMGESTCVTVTGDFNASGNLVCSSCKYDLSACLYCGDGIVNNDEACDGSVPVDVTCASITHDASASGKLACINCRYDLTNCIYCGDGKENGDEECDKGDENNDTAYNGCTKACKWGPRCGDNVIQDGEGEECDNGTSNNDTAYNGCTKACKLGPRCGDGKKNGDEECDKGTSNNDTAYNGCTKACKLGPRCGDNIIQDGEDEECDKGDENNDTAYNGCTKACKWGPRCGDNVIQDGEGEECDNGTSNNDTAYNGCTKACKLGPRCGDGKKNGDEECDKGTSNNDTAYNGCTKACKLGPRCGDGVKNGPEKCDKTDFGDLTCADALSVTAAFGTLMCNSDCEIISTDCSLCKKPSDYDELSGFTDDNTFVICSNDSLDIWLNHRDDTHIPNLNKITNLIIDGTIEITDTFNKSISTEGITNIQGVNNASFTILDGRKPIFENNDTNLNISDISVLNSEFKLSTDTHAVLMNDIMGVSTISNIAFDKVHLVAESEKLSIGDDEGIGILFGTTNNEGNITLNRINIGSGMVVSPTDVSSIDFNNGNNIDCLDSYNSNVGGLVGLSLGTISISNSDVSNFKIIKAHKNVAALIGKASKDTTINNVAIGKNGLTEVKTNNHGASGAIGYLGLNATLTIDGLSVYSLNLYARKYAGAIIGTTDESMNSNLYSISNIEVSGVEISYNDEGCDISGSDKLDCGSFGGLFGAVNSNVKLLTSSSSSISNSVTTIDAKECDYVGGVIGYMNGNLLIEANQSTYLDNNVVKIQGDDYIGGLVGIITGKFDISGSTQEFYLNNHIGKITGKQNLGGLIGSASSTDKEINIIRVFNKVDEITTKFYQEFSNIGGVVGIISSENSFIKNVINEVNNLSGGNSIGGVVGTCVYNNDSKCVLKLNTVSNAINNMTIGASLGSGFVGRSTSNKVEINYAQSVVKKVVYPTPNDSNFYLFAGRCTNASYDNVIFFHPNGDFSYCNGIAITSCNKQHVYHAQISSSSIDCVKCGESVGTPGCSDVAFESDEFGNGFSYKLKDYNYNDSDNSKIKLFYYDYDDNTRHLPFSESTP